MNFTNALQIQAQITKVQSELEAKLLEVEALEAHITALKEDLQQTLSQPTKEEVLKKLNNFFMNSPKEDFVLNREIIKQLGLGMTPHQISDMGLCSHATVLSKYKAVATALGTEKTNLNKIQQILSVLVET